MTKFKFEKLNLFPENITIRRAQQALYKGFMKRKYLAMGERPAHSPLSYVCNERYEAGCVWECIAVTALGSDAPLVRRD